MFRSLISLVLIVFQGTAMAAQTTSALTDGDLKRLEEQRAVVTRYLDEDGLEKYETAPGKLGTLRALLTAKVFSPEQTYELQSMGIVLGDVFVQEHGVSIGLSSRMSTGRDPAIRFQDTKRDPVPAHHDFQTD